MTDKKSKRMHKNVIFGIYFVSWTKFPPRENVVSVFSFRMFIAKCLVNICLKYITFRQILLEKNFLFLDPMNISWIRFKTVVLYGAKQMDDILG